MKIFNRSFFYIIWRIIFIATATYLVTGAVLFFNKRAYIYYPDKTDFYACPYFKENQKIDYNGTRFYFKENGKNLVILYHGNAGSACDRTLYASYFDSHDISYILVEYGGFADDPRKPSRKIILEDVENVISFLKNISGGYSRLTILGESIGGAIALEHSKLQSPDKLILISPFTKLSDVARIHYKFFPYPEKFLKEEEYDSLELVGQYKKELLIIHGENDQIVPVRMAKGIFGKASKVSKKEILMVPKAEHNDLLIHNEVFEKILEFTLSLDKTKH